MGMVTLVRSPAKLASLVLALAILARGGRFCFDFLGTITRARRALHRAAGGRYGIGRRRRATAYEGFGVITPEEVARIPLFSELDDRLRARIAASAADVRLRADEWFAHEGETPSFFALISGRFEVLKRYGNAMRSLAVREPGDYLGEIPIVLGTTFFASARTLEVSRLLRIDAADFRRLLRESPKVRGEVLETIMSRVEGLEEESALEDAPPVIVGGRFDAECHAIRDFLARNRQPFEWYDPADGRPLPRGLTVSGTAFPLVFLPGGECLTQPKLIELAEALGLRTRAGAKEYDVAIVGGGPGGLAAAVYGASEGLRTLLLERYATGGQAGTSSRIENYLGFPSGLSGDELAHRAQTQAERFGAEIVVGRDVRSIEVGAPFHRITLDDGQALATHAIVIATGVTYRQLEVPGMDRFLGVGVFYGAARTEAPAMRDRDIVLVGGGNSAGQAAMFFSDYARCVTILIRAADLRASMSSYLIDELATRDNVRVRALSEIVAVEGGERLEAIVVRDRRAGTESREPADALFVFIGADAFTDWLPQAVVRDQHGYVCTGRDVLDLVDAGKPWPHERDPYLLETSVPGIFAAGDVRHGSIKRVAASVGEGSMAIAFVHTYLASLAGATAERQNGRA
jgi:thioredoxin reductase (NADPH)